MKRKEPRFAEELEPLRRERGLGQKDMLCGERGWRKILEGECPSGQTLISVLTHPTKGLNMREASIVNLYLIKFGHSRLTQESIEGYKLIPPPPESPAVEGNTRGGARIGPPRLALVAHY